ncbi:MAG TPA: STAS domain-containing protein [Solirubrobacteraceae bacterium]|nr:STAS domain-containing protein [Solirubrobacteraceae bacterium]
MLPPRSIPEPDPDVVVCDVGALEADLAAVELLARLRLEARRLGCGLRLRGASRELEQMVAFCGLCDVLPVEEEEAGGGLFGGGSVG